MPSLLELWHSHRFQRCCRLLQNNSEHAFVVVAAQIWADRLGFAGQRLMATKGLLERLETSIGIDVIDDDRTTRSQAGPGSIHLEAHVSLAMEAVMDKKVDLAKLSE
jgi:hypothetical protein